MPQLATVPVLPVVTEEKIGRFEHGVFRGLANAYIVPVAEVEMWRLDTRQLSTEMKVTQYGGRHCHSAIDVGLTPACLIVTAVTLYKIVKCRWFFN